MTAEVAWQAGPSNSAFAWADLSEGFRRSWFWSALAMQDIRLRYRGSILGPFWLTLSTAVMIVAMGFLYSKLFKMNVSFYLPFLTVGIIMWTFISALIIEGCTTFTNSQALIQSVPMPYSIHAYRQVYRNLIVWLHNVVLIPPLILIFGVPIGWSILEVIPAVAMYAINGIWIGVLLGMVSARYRDVPPIVTSLLQVVFFVTPVFWPVSNLGRWQALGELNPLFALIDIARAPLLGTATAPYSWPIVMLLTLVGGAVTFAIFTRFHSRIVYWL
jgi:ABC-type polysaccharide/polyol phosphate export permease